MTQEEFKHIDNMEIKYKYVEKNPIKLFKKKLDFDNLELMIAFNITLLIALGVSYA